MNTNEQSGGSETELVSSPLMLPAGAGLALVAERLVGSGPR
jgi:hypothetical protein